MRKSILPILPISGAAGLNEYLLQVGNIQNADLAKASFLAVYCAEVACSLGFLCSVAHENSDLLKGPGHLEDAKQIAQEANDFILEHEKSWLKLLPDLLTVRNAPFVFPNKYSRANKPTAFQTAIAFAKLAINAVESGNQGIFREPEGIPVLALDDLNPFKWEIMHEVRNLAGMLDKKARDGFQNESLPLASPITQGTGEDETAYVPASQLVEKPRFPDLKAIRKALDENQWIQRRRPKGKNGKENPHRLKVHAADWHRFKTQNPTIEKSGPLDTTAAIVDAALEASRRKVEIDKEKLDKLKKNGRK